MNFTLAIDPIWKGFKPTVQSYGWPIKTPPHRVWYRQFRWGFVWIQLDNESL